tara:strand:+ start:1327 stop:2466 length:1140 start_codon:yes stop_codon:yes gene_type:complete
LKKNSDTQPIQILGAGVSGLSAAITLAKAGCRVEVHEAKSKVGQRFDGDLQGLENWSTKQNVLAFFNELGLTTKFACLPCNNGHAFDAWGKHYPVSARKTLFYMIERGSSPDTLDSALLKQAQSLGVEVIFNSRLEKLDGTGVLAAGPKMADAIAVGYHFQTTMKSGYWVLLDDEIAPQGYAYLLVMKGKGTVKSCTFSDFKREQEFVSRTVEAFQKLAGLEMVNPRPHGGAGNFRMPERAVSGTHPIVGEQAGFQDFLWGFGMRYAILSGVLAARCLLDNRDYEKEWRKTIRPLVRSSLINRVFFSKLGNRGYRWFLERSRNQQWDTRRALYHLYKPRLLKGLLYPWASRQYHSQRQDVSCQHINCNCVWCRHGNFPH